MPTILSAYFSAVSSLTSMMLQSSKAGQPMAHHRTAWHLNAQRILLVAIRVLLR